MVDFVCKDSYDLRDFIALIDYLRSPKGCPWDREQTHESIRRNVLEEAYEVCEAIDEGSPEHLCEELGDLLMQVIFHASMAKDEGAFDMDAIADMACKKLVHRHPHVFGEVAADTPEKVLENWDAIKRADRGQQSAASAMDGIPRGLPGLMRSEKIQGKAAKLGFDGDEKGGKETEEARFARIREAVMTDLKHTFRPEFLNRIDEIIVFRQLTQENIVEIARRMLTVTGKRMAQQGITLISDDDAVAELARDGFDPQYGARPLRRAIQNQVEDAVAELMLEGKLKSGDTAHVRLRDGKVVIDSEAVPAEAVSAAEAPAETAAIPAEK